MSTTTAPRRSQSTAKMVGGVKREDVRALLALRATRTAKERKKRWVRKEYGDAQTAHLSAAKDKYAHIPTELISKTSQLNSETFTVKELLQYFNMIIQKEPSLMNAPVRVSEMPRSMNATLVEFDIMNEEFLLCT